MKLNLVLLVGGVCAGLAGCASFERGNGLVLDSVGPGPGAPHSDTTNGNLLVYSAYQVNADFDSRDPHRHAYSDYQILYPDGTLLRPVHNDTGSILQRAMTVTLPAGTYHVLAEANGFGLVTVPVTIEAGKSTVVHLEGGVRWPEKWGANQTNAVHLPDGQIVGWRSGVSAP
jgi:hypothetical protein